LDYLRSELVRLEHGHGKDGWHSMEEVHDPAQRDQEREWGRHRIYRCTTCEDEIRIEMPEAGQGR
jgi:hypothetical protein